MALHTGACTHALTGLLGVLKAGAAVLPLDDPQLTAERRSALVSLLQPCLLLTTVEMKASALATLPLGDRWVRCGDHWTLTLALSLVS